MWYNENGPMSDVVLSSRVRLARNIKALPFVGKMTSEQEQSSIDTAKRALEGQMDLDFLDMNNLADTDKLALAERHLISRNMLDTGVHRALLLSKSQNISIMLNEEDHIRIQCMEAGFDPDNCMSLANQVDDALESAVEYGFDPVLGYLTRCPTNVGTGLRASVMLHLPALVITGSMEKIIGSVASLGMTVRGLFGEGSQALGNLFQISNQITLGSAEFEILQKLKEIIEQIIAKEREARSILLKNNPIEFEDRIRRAYGILTNARLMPSGEFMNIYSDVRLGVVMGIIKDVPGITSLMYEQMPANITQKYGGATDKDRDVKRCEIIKEYLTNGGTHNV